MKKIIFLFFLFLLSCQQKITKQDVLKLNGYWEIEKVTAKDQDDKKYIVNETYDFFKINTNNTGFRQKVMPQLNGTFLTNTVSEKVKVRFEKNDVFLDYTTPYSKWSEKLIKISDLEFVIINAQEKTYFYKKASPISITKHGKKTQ